jgi:hypothetical protein
MLFVISLGNNICPPGPLNFKKKQNIITLLLLSAATALHIISETELAITCNLPLSVWTTLGISSSYTIKKLNEKRTTEEVFKEYGFGTDGQTAIFRIMREIEAQFNLGNISASELSSWKYTLRIHARDSISKATMKIYKMSLIHGTSQLKNVEVWSLLDKIRGSKGFQEFADFLDSLDDGAMRRLATTALKSTLRVTELESTISVELPLSIASELGSTSFHLIKIDETTSTRQVFDEFEYAGHNRKTTRDLINVLTRQKDDGRLSIALYNAWYSHGLLMLSERRMIIDNILMIEQIDSSYSSLDAISIFDWRRGRMGLQEFARRVLASVTPPEWSLACSQYREFLAETSEFIDIALPRSIATILGIRSYRFIRISSTTAEEILLEEFEQGFYGQNSLGMLSFSHTRRNIRGFFGLAVISPPYKSGGLRRLVL